MRLFKARPGTEATAEHCACVWAVTVIFGLPVEQAKFAVVQAVASEQMQLVAIVTVKEEHFDATQGASFFAACVTPLVEEQVPPLIELLQSAYPPPFIAAY